MSRPGIEPVTSRSPERTLYQLSYRGRSRQANLVLIAYASSEGSGEQSRLNLRCSLIQAVSQEEPSDRKPDPWPIWMAGHAQLKFNITECSKTQIRLTELIFWIEVYMSEYCEISISYMSPVKRICVFEHSVMTNFNFACPAIQRGQGSGFLSEGSSWLTACMNEQRRFWRDCADAQARLNLRCSHRR